MANGHSLPGRPMRTLAVNTFMSLDGVMQAPGGPEEDPTGGFTLGGWAVNYFDDEMMGRGAGSGPYELLLGRGTYEIFAAHWPYDEGPVADHLNRTRKHVASATLDRVEWSNSTLISGDALPRPARSGRLVTGGSGSARSRRGHPERRGPAGGDAVAAGRLRGVLSP